MTRVRLVRRPAICPTFLEGGGVGGGTESAKGEIGMATSNMPDHPVGQGGGGTDSVK